MLLCLAIGQHHGKSGTFIRGALGVDQSTMVLRYFPAKRKSNAVAAEFCPVIELLENREHLIGIFSIEANAIIGNLNAIIG